MVKTKLSTETSTIGHSLSLEAVHLSENETAAIFFTEDMEKETAHYCGEEDLRGYVVCHGEGCVL